MEEDIKICKDKINFLNEKYADEHGEDYFPVLAITTTFNARTILAFENVLRRLEQLEKENKELKANQCDHNISNECLRKSVIRDKIEEYLEFDKKHKRYTCNGRECFTFAYFKAEALKEILGEE